MEEFSSFRLMATEKGNFEGATLYETLKWVVGGTAGKSIDSQGVKRILAPLSRLFAYI